jgi:hypothetical protein|mmetsp:Transcript_27270/g.49534  ORF Transcript_27270/g.49534 Transcript_27270/m.49534 type:complete len:426 (-) Transcript_27270:134-1411(-)|eukprot:CAMPEP_0198302692 /NCGR_PEP_ID=MMETSP1449-20131203/56160_1 /TAXON_ID=420275 /ORGANISM="Attheya septentrionalis, Strain CCMP2084" /LENGTH=425 /DNA_ID=CAMNT_0044005131 /DNA_START=52 /DNA_END=1329 /DNA_ORIENTATION=-
MPSAEDEDMKAEDAKELPNPALVNPDAFREDEELRLGRANGNVYNRKAGIDGVHDGQIMVRLKKKRFIVIDYGIIPNQFDFQLAHTSEFIKIPPAAGTQKCVTSECPKVGIPVLVHDSNPDEPPSLYMRSGLCFTCQRNLNEKRRTQRKRKSDIVSPSGGATANDMCGLSGAAGMVDTAYAMETSQKRFKLNGEVIELSHDAIVINGPLEGTKHQSSEYGYQEIGNDLLKVVQEASGSTGELITAVSSATTSSPSDSADAATYAAVAAAATAAAVAQNSSSVSEEAVSAANAAVAAAAGEVHGFLGAANEASNAGATKATVGDLYEKALLSLSKCIFLLSQWKLSWDATSPESASSGSGAEGISMDAVNDAVASAAAAVAAHAAGQDQNSSSMIPLLLAAEAKGDSKEQTSEKAGEDAESTVFSV